MVMNRRRFIAGCGCLGVTSLLSPGHAISDGAATFGNRVCAFGGSVTGAVSNVGRPSEQAVRIIGRITDGVGIRRNFKILAADIEHWLAFATIHDEKRYIVYDRSSFSWPDGQALWAGVLTFGHEVGHHIASHVFANEQSQHEQELEADQFAGFAMYKLGATLEQATARFWDWPASSTHPAGLVRKNAVADGWHQAAQMAEAKPERCTPGLIGTELDVDGASCRIVRSCEGGGETLRLACKDYDDRWRWMR